MKLQRPPYPQVIGTAGYFWVHAGHRETAITHAIDVIREISAKDCADCDDPIQRELTATVGNWAVESLIQGAWVREYHEWEKATKRYFEEQHRRNGNSQSKLAGSHVEKVRSQLTLFGAIVSDRILDTLDAQRRLINSAKHEEEYFATEQEYRTLTRAVADFWSELAELERFTPPLRPTLDGESELQRPEQISKPVFALKRRTWRLSPALAQLSAPA